MIAKYQGKKQLTKTDIYRFTFETQEPLHFIAGQFTQIVLGRLMHWFTISSRPNGSSFSITTRLTDSDFKQTLYNLEPGQEIKYAAPMGDFVLTKDPSTPVVMVAAGIGITPALSILSDLEAHKKTRDLHLIYASSTAEDFIDLSVYKKQLKSYRQIIGRLTPEDIFKELKPLTKPYVYLSGPEKMVEGLTKELLAQGLDSERVVTDYFPGYD